MNTIRVLVVEDDTRIAEMHRYFAEKVPGFEVVGIAQNLEEARELTRLLAPDLLLLDLYMPDGNGMEILHELRGEGRAVDVILITAAKHVADVQTALRAGAFDYLVKPVVFSRFEQALTRFLNFRRMLDRDTTFEQKDIDELNQPLQSAAESVSEDVPKGIDILTLGKVRHTFEDVGPNGFSAEEMGEAIGASRSTARRYLEYMTTTGELRADVIYGSVGRPERRYFPQEEM
ncbi:MAG: response regulator [Desulfobacterales bacterium]|nr:response regulator [Desulfobacterales bacterium]